jgi:hypothetical protein
MIRKELLTQNHPQKSILREISRSTQNQNARTDWALRYVQVDMICFFQSVERGVVERTTFVSAFLFLLSRVNEDGINLRTFDIQLYKRVVSI